MKKTRSKWFRVAVEGATTDGRTIERDWITQMAQSYNPQTYGARVWLEHIRGILPESPFRAYGDVSAVKADTVTINGEEKLALFAQIEPTGDLINMVKGRQKIYTSMEVQPNFAKTASAYLTGLAVTDSPASLGTEMLAFAQQNPQASPLKDRKSAPDALFSEAAETELEFEEFEDEGGKFTHLTDKLKALFNRQQQQGHHDDELATAISELVEFAQGQYQQSEQHTQALTELKAAHQQLERDFNALKTELEQTPNHPERPAITGGNQQLAQF
ncbi:GPO family capsid scaffolding protein [Celerinatantimonas sp. MCCC 1A17872]|uniref:GPO family capsid scaffolding protein n=1 Tax=Celerinatantimonas sp. MCCC 1A17872 TaxID=3177514 RepID=UPI0038C5A39B